MLTGVQEGDAMGGIRAAWTCAHMAMESSRALRSRLDVAHLYTVLLCCGSRHILHIVAPDGYGVKIMTYLEAFRK